jgi:hypothetical protein
MDNKTWEVSLNVPIITNRDIVWTSRLTYDRNRSYITGLDVAPYFSGGSFFAVGQRVGTQWGRHFLTDCSQLPDPFSTDCGPGKSYQRNQDGFVVWTGPFGIGDGVTNNAWQAGLVGCVNPTTGATVAQTGIKNCESGGNRVNNPWAIPVTHWGMLIEMRDSTGTVREVPLGNTQPDFRLSMQQSFSYKRLSVHALVDGSYGNRLWNQQVHWSLGDFMVRYEDQDGKTVESAKPLGYYWRAPQPDNGAGVGGFYSVLGRNNRTVDKGSYTKLREVSVGYSLGAIRGVGDWSVTLVGRNLLLLTEFYGWDPETGGGGGTINSDAVGAVQGTGTYPQMRTFTLSIGTRF